MFRKIFVISIALMVVVAIASLTAGGVDDDAAEVAVNPPGTFPIVDERITLTGFGRLDPQHGPWEEMTLWQVLEDKTNIRVEWETPGNDNYEERKNLILASGDLPDIFIKNVLSESDLIRYGNDGALVALDQFIDPWMPNVQRLFDEIPGSEAVLTTPDGHIYGLPSVTDYGPGLVWRSPLMNMVWLDNLGLDPPKTADEFLDVLRAFRDGDPNGNGDSTDEIPFTSHNAFMGLHTPAGMFGVRYDIWYTPSATRRRLYPISLADDGTVDIQLDTDGYRDTLRWYATAYQEGLIDNEIFVHTAADYFAKGAAGRVGFTPLYQPRNFATYAKDYDAIVPPVGPDGHQIWNYVLPKVTELSALAMTSANQHPEATARWFDWFFSEEGTPTVKFPTEDFYDVQADGSWQYKDEILEAEIGFEAYMGQHTIFPGGGEPGWDVERTLAPSMAGTPMISYIEKTGPYLVKGLPPGLRTASETQRETEIRSDLDVYVEETVSKFVSGEIDIDDDSEWASWISTLDRLGMQELENILYDTMNR